MRTQLAYSKDRDVSGVDFVAEDGRVMFAVDWNKDKRSIEVRSVEVVRVDGVLYSNQLQITPKVSNSVNVSTEIYEA